MKLQGRFFFQRRHSGPAKIKPLWKNKKGIMNHIFFLFPLGLLKYFWIVLRIKLQHSVCLTQNNSGHIKRSPGSHCNMAVAASWSVMFLMVWGSFLMLIQMLLFWAPNFKVSSWQIKNKDVLFIISLSPNMHPNKPAWSPFKENQMFALNPKLLQQGI